MENNFKVGEVVVIVFSRLPDYPVGMEVTILADYGPNHEPAQYLIDRKGIVCTYSPAKCLTRKKPPSKSEELGEWELCPWRPMTHATSQN